VGNQVNGRVHLSQVETLQAAWSGPLSAMPGWGLIFPYRTCPDDRSSHEQQELVGAGEQVVDLESGIDQQAETADEQYDSRPTE
jgi:hypothetical protein